MFGFILIILIFYVVISSSKNSNTNTKSENNSHKHSSINDDFDCYDDCHENNVNNNDALRSYATYHHFNNSINDSQNDCGDFGCGSDFGGNSNCDCGGD